MYQGTQGDFADLSPSWARNTRDFRGERDGDGYVIVGTGVRGAMFLRDVRYVKDHPVLQFMHNRMIRAADETELESLLTYLQKELDRV